MHEELIVADTVYYIINDRVGKMTIDTDSIMVFDQIIEHIVELSYICDDIYHHCSIIWLHD